MVINSIDDLQHIVLQMEHENKLSDKDIDSTESIIDGYNKTLDILHGRLVDD
jgi:hypothetical protein